MNGNDYLADTNVLIYLLSGNKTIEQFLQGKNVFVSFITEIEILSKKNMKPAERKIIRQLLDDCVIIDLNSQIKEETILLKQESSLKIPDAIIAATAKYFGLPLLTNDDAFSKLPDASIAVIQIG